MLASFSGAFVSLTAFIRPHQFSALALKRLIRVLIQLTCNELRRFLRVHAQRFLNSLQLHHQRWVPSLEQLPVDVLHQYSQRIVCGP